MNDIWVSATKFLNGLFVYNEGIWEEEEDLSAYGWVFPIQEPWSQALAIILDLSQ